MSRSVGLEDTMDTDERRSVSPSEVPTQPAIRLPRFVLPRALPQIPWLRGWMGEDVGRAVATGARPAPGGRGEAGKEAWHGRR